MNTNEDLPQVHAPAHLPSRNSQPATNETIEETNPSNEPENREAQYDSEDEPVARFKSGNATAPNNVPEDATDAIFASDDETLPNFDSEDESEDWFEDKNTRIAFIQKVLAVKLLQLLEITGVIVVVFLNCWRWRIDNILNNSTVIHLIVLCIFGFIVTNIVTFSFLFGRNVEEARRKNPFRYMFLVVYPLRISALILICTLNWNLTFPAILIMTYYCVVVFALLVYSTFAYQTNLDFTLKYSIAVAMGTQIIMSATTATVAFTIHSFWYFHMETYIHFLCASMILILEYIYIAYAIAAMTSKNYWRTTPADFLDGAINLQIDYYHIIRNFVVCVSSSCGISKICDSCVPVIRDKSKKIMKRVDEAFEV